MRKNPVKKLVLNQKYIHELNEIINLSTNHVCAIFASDCANHVLEILEKDYEINFMAKHAILAPHRWVSHDIGVLEAKVYAQKMHLVARSEDDDVLKYFYRGCGHAAASVHTKKHAIHATNYLIKALLVSKHSDMEDVERKWQIKHLLDLGLKA